MSSNASASASSGSNGSNGSNASGALNSSWKGKVSIASGVLGTILFITSFILISQFAGGKDEIETIKKEVLSKIWPLTLVGSFLLFIALTLYVIQDPNRTMYIVLGLSCLSLSLSYSALAVSVISKK